MYPDLSAPIGTSDFDTEDRLPMDSIKRSNLSKTTFSNERSTIYSILSKYPPFTSFVLFIFISQGIGISTQKFGK